MASPPIIQEGITGESDREPLHHKVQTWQPRCEYQEAEIKDLVPGPGCVALVGRIVNLHDQQSLSNAPNAARGCLKIVVKDDTGAILVRRLRILLEK